MQEKFDQILSKFEEITNQLSSEEVLKDMSRYKELAKKRAEMEELVGLIEQLKELDKTIEDDKSVVSFVEVRPEGDGRSVSMGGHSWTEGGRLAARHSTHRKKRV